MHKFVARQIVFAAILFFAGSEACRADSFLLKSGAVVKGKVVEKKDDIYVVDTGWGKVDVPFSQVSIADIDPTSTAIPKGTVSFVNDPSKKRAAPDTSSNMRFLPDSPGPSGSEVPHFANSGVLKVAEDAVNLSNNRTNQTVEEVNKMKAIADAANPDTGN